MRIVIPAGILLVLASLTQLPKIIDFIQSGSIGNVAGTDSKLRYVVSPLETLGIWPSGSWLLGTHDVTHYWIFGAIGLAGLIIGLVWWIGRVDYAVPAAVLSGIAIWLATKYIENGGLYILAKAVVVPASVVMLLVIVALLSPGGGWPKRIFAVVFIALAGYSSFLALRDIVVAPHDRLEEMSSFEDKVNGQKVLALTSDRFTDYGLRSAEVSSPAFNAELKVDSSNAKAQRLPIDFDSVPDEVLNDFPYAITTSSVYQSGAPPGWTLAASSRSYNLWRRTSRTPNIAILAEEARPGRIFRCSKPKFRKIREGGGEAEVWQPRPVIGKRLYWKGDGGTDNQAEPGQSISQTIALPVGTWTISLQYVSPVTGVTVSAPGLDEHLPAGVDAAIPYRPDQGPYWPVGEITTDGGPVTFTVQADDVNRFQSLIGVDAPAVIGNLTAVNASGFGTLPTAEACGLYVDRVIGGTQRSAVRAAGKSMGKNASKAK